MESIPLLETLKKYKTNFNVTDFISLPVDTPFGNFNLTYTEIVTRVECLNETIISLYKDFYAHKELVKLRSGWSTLSESFKHRFQIEQVIYWLRKTADELISIISILKDFADNKSYPNQIRIASIGKFLNSKQFLDESLEKHIQLLKTLNEISNGYKHSLINAQINAYRGQDEPVVFALSAFNDVTSVPIFHQVSLRTILELYDTFLKDCKEILDTKYHTGTGIYA